MRTIGTAVIDQDDFEIEDIALPRSRDNRPNREPNIGFFVKCWDYKANHEPATTVVSGISPTCFRTKSDEPGRHRRPNQGSDLPRHIRFACQKQRAVTMAGR